MLLALSCSAAACGDDEIVVADSGADGDGGGDGDGDGDGDRNDAGDGDGDGDGGTGLPVLTLRSDITPITDVEAAQDGVFIPPFESCKEDICTNVAISGATEEGEKFAEQADCDIVRTQRPFWPRPPAAESKPNDPRLNDEAYVTELEWVTAQIEATGCICCHDSDIVGGQAGIWDVKLGPPWTDSLSDGGLALFLGFADSSVLGAYPEDDNHGFDRTRTGIPTTDTERMKAFWLAEMEHRGLTEDELREVPPFGGPIYENSVAAPEPCDGAQGIDEDGHVVWTGGPARYVYVLEVGSKNPGVPPNLDTPDGTLWRLDVLASDDPLASGVPYGQTPAGSFQAIPETTSAPALDEGTTYHLVVLRDVGVPVTSCLFEYGAPIGEVDHVELSVCDGMGAELGTACTDDSMCTCDAASFCALMPGAEEGICTATGCVEDPSVCPAEWSCFDVSLFMEGAPSICIAP